MNSISIDKLRPHPSNNLFFDDLSGDDWDSFLEDIRANGIRDPLKITTDFQIVCGHQRYRAAIELGIPAVPFDMVDIQNPEDIEELLVVDNLHRRHLTPLQKAKLAATLKERWGIKRGGANGQNVHSLKDVAAVIGESEKTTQRLIKLNDLIPDFKKLVESKKLGTVFAEKLASFTTEEQQALHKVFGDEIGKTAKAEAEQFIQETIDFERKQIERRYKDAIPKDLIPDIQAAAVEKHQEETSLLLQAKDKERDQLLKMKDKEWKDRFEKDRKNDEFTITTLRTGLEQTKEELKALKVSNPADFDEKAAELQKKKLQHEADLNTIQLRILYKNFIEKAAVGPFQAGAIAASNSGDRQRLSELVDMAELIINQTKLALSGRKAVNDNG